MPPKIRRQTCRDRSIWARSWLCTGRIGLAGLQVVAHLLNERQHRPEGVVHVMRDAAGKLRHRVLAFGRQHPRAKRLRSLEILDGACRLIPELLHELSIVRAGRRPAWRASDLDDTNETIARHQRRAEHGAFPQVLGGRIAIVVVVEQTRKPGHRLAQSIRTTSHPPGRSHIRDQTPGRGGRLPARQCVTQSGRSWPFLHAICSALSPSAQSSASRISSADEWS